MNGGDQRGQGQSYGGGLPLSEFNKLVPPGWRPGIPGYPIKLFFERLKLWYRVTDNAEAQLGILVAGRLQGASQKIALRLRLPRPVAAGGGYDIGDEALIRLSQEQVIDPANNTIVQEYIPSGLQFLCQALRAIYGLQDQDRTTVALDSFYEFKRGHLGLAEFAQEFDHRYESAEDEAGLQMNDPGKTYFFLRGSGLGDKIIEDIKLQMRGDMSRYQEIRTLVLKLARAIDKDKETLNMYQDQTDFNYKVNLDETNGNYYGSWHDPTTGEIIEYDYGANTSDDMYYGDYDYIYDGEYSDYDGAGYDDDWYGDDGWQDEVYHGDFPLEEWTWPASAPDSISVSTAETTLLDVDPSYWKGQTKGKGKGFGAKGKGPSGGSASGIGCATCGSRWHSSLDCPLNDPSKCDQGKGKGGKDYHYENFWKGKGKGKKGGKSKGFGKGWSKGFGKYRPSFGSGKGYGKYSGGYGKSYGKSYGKGKFKGGYGGFRYSSPYNFTAFQDYEVQEAPEHAPTVAVKADGSGTQYYDFEDEKPSSSTRPPPQSTTEPMIDTADNPGYNDGYGELDTATAPVPDVRVNSLSFLVGTCSSAFPTDHEDWSSLYHSVRGVKRHGLLVDPGAASGLIGSDTLKEFRDEILLPLGVDIICRPTTHNVSGISGKPEPALSRVTMPIFPGIKSSTFTADVIGKQGSKCPALLPNPSMRAANMGLLTNFCENGDGMLIVHDNGKRLLYRCLLTESGHYILPADNVKNNNNVDKEATRKASAFYAAVLQDATQQWSDISSVYLAVDKAAVADSMTDHDIFATFIGIVYVNDGIQGMVKLWSSGADTTSSGSQQAAAILLALNLTLGFTVLALWLSAMKSSKMLTQRAREFLSDYALTIALLASVVEADVVNRFLFPIAFINTASSGFNTSSERPWRTDLSAISPFGVACAFVAAFPVVVFFFLDQSISSTLCQRPEMKLKKGSYYHASFAFIAVFDAVAPLFGLPFVTGSLPHSPQFVLALAETDGDQQITGVRENRLAPLLCYLLLGLLLLTPSVLGLVPKAAVSGTLIFVGVNGIQSTRLYERCLLVLTDPHFYPKGATPTGVPLEKVLRFPSLWSRVWVSCFIYAVGVVLGKAQLEVFQLYAAGYSVWRASSLLAGRAPTCGARGSDAAVTIPVTMPVCILDAVRVQPRRCRNASVTLPEYSCGMQPRRCQSAAGTLPKCSRRAARGQGAAGKLPGAAVSLLERSRIAARLQTCGMRQQIAREKSELGRTGALSQEDFAATYSSRRRPVVVAFPEGSFPALDFGRLLAMCGERKLPLQRYEPGCEAWAKMAADSPEGSGGRTLRELLEGWAAGDRAVLFDHP
ncbi:unnamed protein product, partial [Polarella glacialis]